MMDATLRYLLFLILLLPVTAGAAENLRILLTNDDGFDSPGITALHSALLEAGHDVFLIAPATQQSGAAASITGRGVTVTEHPNQVWAVHGRPADAVRVGLGYILYNNPPDLVVSGANFGPNTGQDVNISGTVGAAITAFRLGVPAIAVSVGMNLEERDQGFPSTFGAFGGVGRLVTRLIDNMDLDDMTAVLNVNYPARLPLDIKGVRWTGLSDHSILGKRYNLQKDGSYAPELMAPHPNTRAQDAESLADGFVTLTFLDGDMSVSALRGQKYLDRQLLDRSYEARYVPPAPVKTAPVRNKPTETAESNSLPASTNAVAKEPVKPAPETKDTTLNERKPADSSLMLEGTRNTPISPVPPPDEDAADENKPRQKKKPESWLRRMFDPDSWRR